MLDNADVFGGCRAAGVCIFLLSEAERFVFFLCNQLFVKEEVDLQVIIVDNVQFLCRDAVHRHGVDDGRHEVAHIGESVTAEESVCFLNDGAMADKDNAAADTTFNDAYIIASNMDAGNLVVLSQLFAPPFCSHSRKKEILVSRIFCNYHMFSKFHS